MTLVFSEADVDIYFARFERKATKLLLMLQLQLASKAQGACFPLFPKV